jgi:hypothetical protein
VRIDLSSDPFLQLAPELVARLERLSEMLEHMDSQELWRYRDRLAAELKFVADYIEECRKRLVGADLEV